MRADLADRDKQRASVITELADSVVRRLDLYVDLLLRWQATINLIAPSTIPDIWTRHIGDSLQVQSLLPAARHWLDLGSGGGLPGLVTSIALTDKAMGSVTLVESDKRKAAFLKTVIRETALDATVVATRIEQFVEAPDRFDAVSARALAPLPQLLRYAEPYLAAGATGVFPQGARAGAELTACQADHRFATAVAPSRFGDGSILIVTAAQPVRPSGGD